MDSAAAKASCLPSVRLSAEPPDVEDAWVLAEEDMPESNLHRDIVDLLRLVLLAFVARTRRNALVAANLACRWNAAKPGVGVDPDVALIEPAPPEGVLAESLRTWVPGHVPPRFAVEVVSANNAEKDHEDAPARYARLGTRELVVFDPGRLGLAVPGGLHVLQVWRRDEQRARMKRVYAGDGPAFSEELGAWLVVTAELRLRIADDAEGRSLWLTDAEQQAAEKQRIAAEKQRLQRKKQRVERENRRLALENQRLEREKQQTMLAAIEDMCELCGVELDGPRRAHIASLNASGLEELRAHLKRERAWPP